MQYHKVDCRIWSMGGQANKSNILRSMAIDSQRRSASIGRSTSRLTNLADEETNDVASDRLISPYETPFASETRSGATNRAAKTQRGRRKIVLTTERMNDPLADVDDIAQLQARHRKLFKATPKGWTRVTEIGPDMPEEQRQAKAFGCSVN